MSLWAVTTVRDEADVIGPVLRHLRVSGVDGFVIADNGSRDRTPGHLKIFRKYAGCPVLIEQDRDPAFYQGEKMTRLAGIAGEQGATWIIPFDADEVWCPRETPYRVSLADVFRTAEDEGVPIVSACTFEHVPVDEPRLSRWRRPEPKRMMKVAYRWNPDAVICDGNHDVRGVPGRKELRLQIREFQWRSLDQLRRKVRQGKAALEAATRLDPTTGSHWRRLGAMSDVELEDEWQAIRRGPLKFDPAPWRPSPPLSSR